MTIKEPTYTGLNDSKLEFINALNWYAYNKGAEDSKKYAIEWVSDNTPELLANLYKAKDYEFSNIGFVLRLAVRGMGISNYIERCKNHLNTLADKYQSEVKVKHIKVVKKVRSSIGEIESVLDDALNGINTIVDASKFDKTEVLSLIKEKRAEFKENKEFYNNWNMLMKTLDRIESLFSIQTREAKSKPKKKKIVAINAAKRVEGLELMKELVGYKGQHPIKIFSSKAAIIWNDEYRTATVLYGKNMEIKGKSIINIDEKNSYSIRIRRPEFIYAALEKADFNAILGIINESKCMKTAPKVRLSDKTMILKVLL